MLLLFIGENYTLHRRSMKGYTGFTHRCPKSDLGAVEKTLRYIICRPTQYQILNHFNFFFLSVHPSVTKIGWQSQKFDS